MQTKCPSSPETTRAPKTVARVETGRSGSRRHSGWEALGRLTRTIETMFGGPRDPRGKCWEGNATSGIMINPGWTGRPSRTGSGMPGRRKFPKHSLQDALVIAQKIADEMPLGAMDRLLLADALGLGAASSRYRDLLSASRMYGLTEGTEKAKEVSLLPLGRKATEAGPEKHRARQQVVLAPATFKKFYESYNRNRLPSQEMFPKILAKEFGVPEGEADECAKMIVDNGRFAGLIRDISGRPTVMLDGAPPSDDAASRDGGEPASDELETGLEIEGDEVYEEEQGETLGPVGQMPPQPKAIFVGHGKKTGPLEKLERILAGFQVPYKVAVSEPNLGRPIPSKVKDTMNECGSAILIFTKDEKFFDKEGNEVWRPSENVVHELGAASFAYEDRVVIFKEEGLTLASNFSSIGYIEFQEDAIESKTAELLQELIGFGLLKLTPAA